MTKEELLKIGENSKDDFVFNRRDSIESLLRYAARNQKTHCEVPYHPLLDSFFEELIQGGLKIESRTLDKITLSWST